MKKRVILIFCIAIGCISSLFFRSNEPTFYGAFSNSDIATWDDQEISAVLEKLSHTMHTKKSHKKTYDRINTQWEEAKQKQLKDTAQQGVLFSEGFTKEHIEAAVLYAREIAKKYNPFTRLDSILKEFEQGNWHTEKVFSVDKSHFSEEEKDAFLDLEVTVIGLKDRFKPTASILKDNLEDLKKSIAKLSDVEMKNSFTQAFQRLEKLTDIRIKTLKKK